MANLAVDIAGLRLANPVMPASGTFSEDLARVFDLSILGAHVTKTITAATRSGNPVPRICELRDGMLNSIGIPSKGVPYFLANILPFYADYDCPLIVSVSAGTAAGFGEIAEQLSVAGVAAIEANISCPNLEEDGRAFATTAEATRDVIAAMRQRTDLPIWAKLSPNTATVAEIAVAAEAAGAQALVVSNTLLGMSIDIDRARPRLGNVMGGVSGGAIKPVALRMTYQCVQAVDIPVIGCGGIASAEDALEFLIAGARAVQVGTATFRRPGAMRQIIADLDAWLDRKGHRDLSTVIGSLDTGRAGAAPLSQAGAA